MNSQSDILKRILARKAEENTERHRSTTLSELETLARSQEAPLDFIGTLQKKIAQGLPAVIAEIKKASPSKGVIRAEFFPDLIAMSYAKHGAACLSVLTDQNFFQGHNDFLMMAKEASGLPALRKDFLVDSWQIVESRAIGSDCVLLIAAALSDQQMSELISIATEYSMDVLLEVHSREELERVLLMSHGIIGINNRNLHTFETYLETTIELFDIIPNDRLVVTESGIHCSEDVQRLRSCGIDIFLIGESLMRSDDPGRKLADLCGDLSI